MDVIIPTYKPGEVFLDLVERLQRQTLPPEKIIIMNTEEKYFSRLTYGRKFPEGVQIEVEHISRREFDHGGTRRRGVKRSDADIFVMMTQDALPADEHLLEELVHRLEGNVAVSYARQLPAAGCGDAEKYARGFNYPEQSRIKSAEDLPLLGIKTYFCSNVCAAYRRDIYEELGGFVRRTIFNEDMLYAAKAIDAGYRIAYEADARVIHSHNYTNRQQFHRNFDLGVSQAQHPEVFSKVKSEAEGKKMLAGAASYLRDRGMAGKIPGLLVQTGCKYAGYLLGKHYRLLPAAFVSACSDNKEYWKNAL